MKSKELWCKVLSMVLVITLIYNSTGSIVTASTNDISTTDEQISENDVELLAKMLELIYESGQITEGNNIIGFNRELFEVELQGLEGYEEIITEFEKNELFVEMISPTMSTYVAACGWYLMKDKPEYLAAENECIMEGLQANYGPVTVLATIANLIADKEFKLAAKKILALGIKSNIAGIVVVLASILGECGKEMEKKFPGKSNCY
ncbi:hypothetical protein [Metasolibacillus sp. FSL K6-0083]|uniref:hypothetical protein n=1 Tax=Metasolibacillus sp. FSL K6-0083 TaxID=2921416 RepID=UPI00315A7A88